MNKKREAAATGAQVREARGKRTQREVAVALGVALSTVENWENERSPISKLAWIALRSLPA